MSYEKKDPRDRGYKSVVVVGEYADGSRSILRRFDISEREDANDYAMEHSGVDRHGREFDEILVESSKDPYEGIDERYTPRRPFRPEHLRSVSFVYDSTGREIICVHGPRHFRASIVRNILGFYV